ncbi:MAG: phosphatase PAP2 family protein [Oscillospiraceae bacterium]
MKHFSLKTYIKENPHVWYVLLLPAYLLLFYLAERLVPSDGSYWVSYLPLDDHIPFLEIFIVPYCAWYPLLVGVGLALLLFDGENFKKYMLFIMAGNITALLFCILVPNGQELRPESFERHNVFTWLIGKIYAVDTNTNVFPSMHVIGSVGAVAAAFKSEKLRPRRWPILALAVLVIASTVFVKQHSVLDIFGGLAWCVPLYLVIYGIKGKRKREKEKGKAI